MASNARVAATATPAEKAAAQPEPEPEPKKLDLKREIQQTLAWTVGKAHDEALWRRVRHDVTAHLTKLAKEGHFASTKAHEAFFVQCDRTTMRENDLDNGRLVVHVGVARNVAGNFDDEFDVVQVVHERQTLRGAYIGTIAYAVLLSGLLAARASINSLAFISTGWLLVLALVPLLPVLLPELADLIRSMSPYVSTLKIGQLEVGIRTAEPVVGSAKEVAPMLTDALEPAAVQGVAAQEAPKLASTGAKVLLDAIRRIHEAGSEIVPIDVDTGRRWRLPNLYFFGRLLEADRRVRCVVFTEKRGSDDGCYVGSCDPADFTNQIERSLPQYYAAGRKLLIPTDVSDPQGDTLAKSFNAFREELRTLPGSAPPASAEEDWVSSASLVRLLGPVLDTTALEWHETLPADQVQTIVLSPHRFTALTTDGRFKTAVDRERVALAVARKALAQSG